MAIHASIGQDTQQDEQAQSTHRIVIRKVKYDGSKVEIHYHRERDNGEPEEYRLKCGDEPRPAFHEALKQLHATLADWLELPSPEWLDQAEIRGVSFSDANEIMGATVTASVPLSRSQSPLILNTPHKPAEPYNEDGDDMHCLSEDQVEALTAVMDEAEAYIRGKRSQLTFDYGQNDEAA